MKKRIDKDGYVILINNNMSEHRYLAVLILGRDLDLNEVVHHINGVKSDNDISNLCVMDREKHEQFHSWLDWKRTKRGEYPSVAHQRQYLVEEFNGILLDEVEEDYTNEKSDAHSAYKDDEVQDEKVETFIVRKNKITNKLFIEFEEEFLISPEGKIIELDLERFEDPIEVFKSELTVVQIDLYYRKIEMIESRAIEDQKELGLQMKLFNELRKERRKIALKKNIPVYIVFDNKTLHEMAEVMPESEALMLQISGVGPVKYRMYGVAFISVIKRFKDEHYKKKKDPA